MQFTYDAYINLINLLRDNEYQIANYHNWTEKEKTVILRHDVDQSLDKAFKFAQIETENNIVSTYFVLLNTDFYNVASAKNKNILKKMHNMGHEIGLHFDEVAYEQSDKRDIVELIKKEAKILSEICELPINTVSMHRPSKQTLEANYEIPGIINSYGKTFFEEFKYLSDSRRRWREPVEDIINNRTFDRLHILTHAFWYYIQELDIKSTVNEFINSAKRERYESMSLNITDIEEMVK